MQCLAFLLGDNVYNLVASSSPGVTALCPARRQAVAYERASRDGRRRDRPDARLPARARGVQAAVARGAQLSFNGALDWRPYFLYFSRCSS